MTLDKAKSRIAELEAAIREHRDAKLHDRCHVDDDKLYAVLGDGVKADRELPPLDEFLPECINYWKCRKSGISHESVDARLRRLEGNPSNVLVGGPK